MFKYWRITLFVCNRDDFLLLITRRQCTVLPIFFESNTPVTLLFFFFLAGRAGREISGEFKTKYLNY